MTFPSNAAKSDWFSSFDTHSSTDLAVLSAGMWKLWRLDWDVEALITHNVFNGPSHADKQNCNGVGPESLGELDRTSGKIDL